jgi:hypothetical protein
LGEYEKAWNLLTRQKTQNA